jgi:hypothetical protein
MRRMDDIWATIAEELYDELGRAADEDELNARWAQICAAMHDDHIDR